MNGIAAINREKKKQKSLFPQVGIVTTVSRLNYLHLEDLPNFFNFLPFSHKVVDPSIPTVHLPYTVNTEKENALAAFALM